MCILSYRLSIFINGFVSFALAEHLELSFDFLHTLRALPVGLKYNCTENILVGIEWVIGNFAG